MKQTIKFNAHTNQGTIICGWCGKRTWQEYQRTQCGLCKDCFHRSGLENEHLDYGHPEPVKDCPICEEDESAGNSGTEVDGIQQAAREKAERRFHEEGIARCWQVRDAWCKCRKPLDEFYYERPVSHLHGWACSYCYGITQTG